jgi:hypothetical protein
MRYSVSPLGPTSMVGFFPAAVAYARWLPAPQPRPPHRSSLAGGFVEDLATG